MDSLQEVESQRRSSALDKFSLLTLHCVDMNIEVIVPLKDLPFAQWTARIGHVSFLDELRERRLALFPSSRFVVDSLRNLQSPIVIDVTRSFDVQLKSEDDEEYGEPVLVIWHFNVVLGMIGRSIKPKEHYEDENSKPQMPYLDLKTVECSCSRWPEYSLVLVNTTQSQESVASKSSTSNSKNLAKDTSIIINEEGDNNEAYEEIPLESEIFKLKGCSFHEVMQKALRIIQGKIARKEELDVKIIEQPLNVEDENALIVKVLLGDKYESVGYVPGKKVDKFTAALQNDEIESMTLKQIHRVYIPAINNFMLFGYLQAIKRGKWLPDNKNYTYNC